MTSLTLDDIEAAAARIEGHVRPLTTTPGLPAKTRSGDEFTVHLGHVS